MDIIQEFLDPIPLPIMVLAIFGLLLFVVISKFFRMPDNFTMKEEIREEIKFRLFYKDVEEAAKAAKAAAREQENSEKTDADGNNEANADTASTPDAAPAAEEPKP